MYILTQTQPTGCTVTTSVNIPSGRTLSTLLVGDIVEITVKGQVTAGANTTSGHENGIMQYIHDLTISSAGVLKVTSIAALGSFSKTRAALEFPQGTAGDLGVQLINGYTASFTQGLTGPSDLYRVTLQAIGAGQCKCYNSARPGCHFCQQHPAGPENRSY